MSISLTKSPACKPVTMTAGGADIQGFCDPRFESLCAEFAENFSVRNELGASLAVNYQGERVVDLWGGWRDEANETPWEEDTLVVVFSSTKGATAFALHHLIDSGKAGLDDSVGNHWPEFANAGKESATVRMMLDHSVGVPALRDPVRRQDIYDWDTMVARLEAEAPFWTPGTRNGYHGMTFGWTVGELARRISGQSLGEYFQTALAVPLGIDFWIGLPEAEEPRVAPVIPWLPGKDDPETPFQRAVRQDRNSIPGLFLLNSGGFLQQGANRREGHAAELGAANGITNARGLAGLYAPLANGGQAGDTMFVRPDTIDAMAEVSMATHLDATLVMPTRFSPGFMKSMDNRARNAASVILGARAFGHVGAGGSLGFADPACQLGFGYAMNRMGEGLLLNARGQALVDAAYRCVGYDRNRGGVWAKSDQ